MQFQITFDAADPRRLSMFWAKALGYAHPAPPGQDLFATESPFDAWDRYLTEIGIPEDQHNIASAIEDPEGNGPRIYFQRVPEEKTVKTRLHLDLRSVPGLEGEERMEALEAECRRLIDLGASRLERFEPEPPLSGGFIVMADPEGNEFCLD